jgi:CAAX protease family protein
MTSGTTTEVPHLSRTAAIVLAWLGTAVLFAVVHLPTYNWNLAQILLLIGLFALTILLRSLQSQS